MCFLPLKSSHYPSRPIPVPELFGKYPTRPVPKPKTPTRRTLVNTKYNTMWQYEQKGHCTQCEHFEQYVHCTIIVQCGRKDSMDRRNFLKTPVSKAADSSPLILLPPKSGKWTQLKLSWNLLLKLSVMFIISNLMKTEDYIGANGP